MSDVVNIILNIIIFPETKKSCSKILKNYKIVMQTLNRMTTLCIHIFNENDFKNT